MCITGETPNRIITEFSKQMGVSKAQAGRVIMTESAVFANKARQDCMGKLGVEQFEVIETLDERTCNTCGRMDKQHFPMSDFQTGVTAPPFHPNCRGCTCPYFDDEFGSVGERAARDEDGKTYYVSADTTYEEWKKTFVTKSIETHRDVVPLHFEGRNSDFFYNLANICKALGIKFNIAMLYLADEMLKNRHKTFTLTIGKPIPWQTFDKTKTPAQWAQFVKDVVYKL